MRTPLRGLLAWTGLLVLMIGNGFVRVLWLEPRMGSETARQVASLLGIVLVLAVARLFVRWQPAAGHRALWAVGGLWLVLTLAFELGFGRVSGVRWEDLLADYDLTRGRLWLLVLAAVFTGPRIMAD